MPLDAVCLRAVVDELAPQLTGARIEKIQQPARDQVVLLLRGSRRLLLCANPNQPRIHMTEKLRDNPSQPPMFCMLLRKRIGNGRIVSIEQAPLERVVTLHIEATDELGEQSRFALTKRGVFWTACGVWIWRCRRNGRCCRGCSTICRPDRISVTR